LVGNFNLPAPSQVLAEMVGDMSIVGTRPLSVLHGAVFD